MGEHRWDNRVGKRRRKDAYALSVRLSSIRLSSVRFSPYASRASVPFQRPPFPDVDVAHGENQDEHQHLHEQEPRPYPEGARLPEDRRPGEQEHGLDVEDDEEHRDEIELHGEPLARVPERRHTALVGELFHGCGPPPRDQMRGGDHADRVRDHEQQQQQEGRVGLDHRAREKIHLSRRNVQRWWGLCQPNEWRKCRWCRYIALPCPSNPIAGSAAWRTSTA